MAAVDMDAALVAAYRQLHAEADAWFDRLTQQFPDEVQCAVGCSHCCATLFDISLLDARILRLGLDKFEPVLRTTLTANAEAYLAQLATEMPLPVNGIFDASYPPHTWPDLEQLPCPLLDDQGACRVYHDRPLICRMHGLPLVDLQGQVLEQTGCQLNFIDRDPAKLDDLRWDLQQFFIAETSLIRQYTEWASGQGSIDRVTTIAHVVANRCHLTDGAAGD